MNDGMWVVGKRHYDIEYSFEIRLSRKTSSINIDGTEGRCTTGSAAGVTIIHHFFDKIVDLGSKEGGTAQAGESSESFTGCLAYFLVLLKDALLRKYEYGFESDETVVWNSPHLQKISQNVPNLSATKHFFCCPRRTVPSHD